MCQFIYSQELNATRTQAFQLGRKNEKVGWKCINEPGLIMTRIFISQMMEAMHRVSNMVKNSEAEVIKPWNHQIIKKPKLTLFFNLLFVYLLFTIHLFTIGTQVQDGTPQTPCHESARSQDGRRCGKDAHHRGRATAPQGRCALKGLPPYNPVL